MLGTWMERDLGQGGGQTSLPVAMPQQADRKVLLGACAQGPWPSQSGLGCHASAGHLE